jgi:hypothetical protein
MKVRIQLASLALLCATGVIVAMERQPNVHIVNKAAGYTGQYEILVKTTPTMSATIGKYGFGLGEIKIPYGKSQYVGRLQDIADIETSGQYAQGWTSNKNVLNQIKENAKDYPNADFYLTVTSSGLGFKVTHWHAASPEPQTEYSELIEFISLDDIKKGRLGQDYAQKVKEICNANYTRAVAAGYANLCQQLQNRLKRDVLQGAPSGVTTREDALKRIIDGLYEQLRVYKAQIPGLQGKQFPKFVD